METVKRIHFAILGGELKEILIADTCGGNDLRGIKITAGNGSNVRNRTETEMKPS